MADIDNDGDMDILGGDDVGNIKVFLRNEEGGLHFNGLLSANGETLDVNDRAAPEAVDWDLDSDLDLLVGSSTGTIQLFLNEGSPEEMNLAAPVTIQADGEDIWLGSESAPAMGDLDRDGRRDLVAGSVFGELWFYLNIGADDDPEFGPGVRLSDTDGEIWLSQYTRPDLADWNGDSYLDIICGQLEARVTLFINPGPGRVDENLHPTAPGFKLVNHWPEPFNALTNLGLEINHPARIQTAIYDPKGRLVQFLPDLYVGTGQQAISLNLEGFPAGRYWARVSDGDISTWQTLTLVK
ncbi:MAG: VCBS repeat-containing protein [Calditrichota bacterium]